MMIDLPTGVADLICSLESFRGLAYQDIKFIWTIGYGTTIYPDGVKVKAGDTCTPSVARQYLSNHLDRYVYPLLKPYPDLPPRIYAAMCSLLYNSGNIGPTLAKTLKMKNWGNLPHEFMLYVNVDGKPCQGLINRREAEIKYFTC